MITPEQNKEITQYLVAKNLPIDLVLEVKDHMIEQIESMENLCFEEAFEQVKISWKVEFIYKFSFSRLKMLTNYEISIQKENYSKIFLKTFCYFTPLLIITLLLAYYNTSLYKFTIETVYYFFFIVTGTLLLINFKIQKTTFNTYSKRISVYQKGASNFLVGGLFILIYNVFIPNNDKNLVAIHKLLNFEISFKISFNSSESGILMLLSIFNIHIVPYMYLNFTIFLLKFEILLI